jgi:hypothetical protein
VGWHPPEFTEVVGMVAKRPIWGVTKRPIRKVQWAHMRV